MSDTVNVARRVPGAVLGVGQRALGALGGRVRDVAGLVTGPSSAVAEVDVGAPVDVVYDEWVRFQEGSALLRAAEVVHEVLDDRIVWEADNGQRYVDGAVTFHELAPGLTRVLVVLACDPQGLLARVVGRWCDLEPRVRGELETYRRQVMTRTLIEP
jgi:uncharacterized membrane protein